MSAPYLPLFLPYSKPPTVSEYRQRRESREESNGIEPERKRLIREDKETFEAEILMKYYNGLV